MVAIDFLKWVMHMAVETFSGLSDMINLQIFVVQISLLLTKQ